ncbi:hypothetical protein D3C85_1554000 [compost metagenome]
MAGHPWQVGASHPPWIRMAGVLIVDGVEAADRGIDLVQAKNSTDGANIAIVKAPGGFVGGGQDHGGDPAAAVQLHFITRQRYTAGAAIGADQQFDP